METRLGVSTKLFYHIGVTYTHSWLFEETVTELKDFKMALLCSHDIWMFS